MGVKGFADVFDAERPLSSLRDCGKMPIPRHQNRAPTRIGMKVIQVGCGAHRMHPKFHEEVSGSERHNLSNPHVQP